MAINANVLNNSVINTKPPGIAGSQQKAFQTAMDNVPKSTDSSSGFGDALKGISGMMGGMGIGGIGAAGGDLLAGLGSAIGGDKYGDFSEDEKASQSAIRQGLSMIPVYGQAIAAATGLVDAIGSSTGLNLSSVNKDTANRAGISGTGFNKVMNMLPGNSMVWGGLSAMFGNGRTDQIHVSDEVKSMGASYSGAMGDLSAAEDLGNKRLFF